MTISVHLASGLTALFSEVARWGRGHGRGEAQSRDVLGSRTVVRWAGVPAFPSLSIWENGKCGHSWR